MDRSDQIRGVERPLALEVHAPLEVVDLFGRLLAVRVEEELSDDLQTRRVKALGAVTLVEAVLSWGADGIAHRSASADGGAGHVRDRPMAPSA